jgi:hypothetical protein
MSRHLPRLEPFQDGKFIPLSPRERDRVRGKGTPNPPRRQNRTDDSSLENAGVFGVDCVLFPLTPTLSLGERGSFLLRWARSDALEIARHGKFSPLALRNDDCVVLRDSFS